MIALRFHFELGDTVQTLWNMRLRSWAQAEEHCVADLHLRPIGTGQLDVALNPAVCLGVGGILYGVEHVGTIWVGGQQHKWADMNSWNKTLESI